MNVIVAVADLAIAALAGWAAYGQLDYFNVTHVDGLTGPMAGLVATLALAAGIALLAGLGSARWIGVAAGLAGVAGSVIHLMQAVNDGGMFVGLAVGLAALEAAFFAGVGFVHWRVGARLRSNGAQLIS